MEIKILKKILDFNTNKAEQNKNFLKNKNVKTINILASPGAGKTSLIIRTSERLKNMAVIEGDIESSIDTEKLNKLGIPAVQINTGGMCHLEASMIEKVFNTLDIKENSFLFIENIGNLVCTASYELGEDYKVVILSTAEGHDKPYKYPLIFENADAIILNKIDLLPYTEFSKDLFYKGVRNLNEKCPVFEISCKDNTGFDEWINWLEKR